MKTDAVALVIWLNGLNAELGTDDSCPLAKKLLFVSLGGESMLLAMKSIPCLISGPLRYVSSTTPNDPMVGS